MYGCQQLISLLFLRLLSEACQIPMSAWIVFNWFCWLLMKSHQAVCKLPPEWLVMLFTDLSTNGLTWKREMCFSLPLRGSPYVITCDIGTKLSKIVGNLTSKPLKTIAIELPITLYNYRWVEICTVMCIRRTIHSQDIQHLISQIEIVCTRTFFANLLTYQGEIMTSFYGFCLNFTLPQCALELAH